MSNRQNAGVRKVVLVSFIMVSMLAFVVAPALTLVYAQEADTTVSSETTVETPALSDEEPAPLAEPVVETVPEGTVDSEAAVDVVEESVAPVVEESTPFTPATSPVLTTDKEDYHPGETANIFGSFFGVLKNIVLNIFGGTVEDDTVVDDTIEVSVQDGGFTLEYLLPSWYVPVYNVIARTLGGEIITQTSFTDISGGVDKYDQCSNDDGDGYATGDTGCRWTNGNLQFNNSVYHEDDATVQRLLLKDVSPGSHTVLIKYGTTKGGKHAYDFLTDDYFSELSPNAITDADLCGGLTGFPSCASTASSLSGLIPADPNAAGYDVARSARHFKIRNGSITSVGAPTLFSGSYAADSETTILLTFDVPTTCADKSKGVCPVLITWGAHVSTQADWGTGNSAVNISGSPYHVAIDAMDGAAVGQRDNQMQAGAVIVPQGAISGVKFNDANGNGVKDPSEVGIAGWSITLNPGTTVVTDGSGLYSFGGLTDGTYSVCETFQTGWVQTYPVAGSSIVACPNGLGYQVILSGGNLVTNKDFGNTQVAHLTLVKTVTNDNGGTAANTAWTLTANGTGANDISGTTGSGAVTNVAVVADTFTLSETGGPTGYTAGSWSCTGGTQNGSNITLAAGQSATCTINNNDNQSYVIVDKTVVNDNGGSADANDFLLTVDANAVLDEVAYPVNPGAHVAGETNLPGYTAGTWGGDCDAAGNVSVALGETKTCTITNNDQQAYITVVKVVTNDNGGNADPDDFDLTLEGNGVSSGVQVPVNPGSYTAGETLLSGYTFEGFSGDCDSSGDVTVALGESKTCTITNDDIAPTLTIVKNAAGGDDTFNFNVTGPTGSTPSITTVANTGTTGAQPVTAGAYTVSETVPANWVLTASMCVDNTNPLVDLGTSFNLALAQNVTCTFENTHLQTTRTQGFWATHMSLADSYWTDGTLICGARTIDSTAELMGGFWSDLAKKSTGVKRSTLDQARMQLMQQLLAAMLNNTAFGSSPLSGITIPQAQDAFCNGSLTTVKNAASAMASFNTSGDSVLFTPGVAANGKQAKGTADRTLWDLLP